MDQSSLEIRQEIIKAMPIGNSLDGFRLSFDTSKPLEMMVREDIRDPAFGLIVNLQNTDACRLLPVKGNRGGLHFDLASLNYQIANRGHFDLDSIKSLIKAVLANKPDQEIWDQVYNAVAASTLLPKTPTPPLAFEKANLDTPLRPTSASQTGPEQTHDQLDQRILEELEERVYYNVGRFFERYFVGKSWSNEAEDICEKLMAHHTEGSWKGFPKPAVQEPFFRWFKELQNSCLGSHGCNGRKYYTSANRALTGSEADRKLDIFLSSVIVELPDQKHDWSNVLVIGEHKQNPNEDGYLPTLIQLAGYAREVFGNQPDRRFIPGFTICESLMRLWIFDRSGVYNSENFDIHKEPDRFAKTIAGYMFMTDAELGLNTFIKHDEYGKFVTIQNGRIYLESKPIAMQKAIACRGTTCYRGKLESNGEWKYVVKFSWPSDMRQREGRLLQLAKEKGVKGVADWVYYKEIIIDDKPDTITNLRRLMDFGKPKRLSDKASWVCSGMESNQGSKKRSVGKKSKSSTTRKRKLDDHSVDGSGTKKRSKLADSGSGPSNMQAKEHDLDTTRFHSIQEAESDSLVGQESETYGNRIHCCLIVSPAGRPLQDYKSLIEFLIVLRDAIKGHRSLLEKGGILHRDISINNIIITDTIVEGDPKGLLIDLDLAKELKSASSKAGHRTGTMEFMAIEVLRGKGHTYRHDLESFFYVFLWMCVRSTRHNSPKQLFDSNLRLWYTGTYSQIASVKLGHMDKNSFEREIIAEFGELPETLKMFARNFRQILFPIRDGALFTGTFLNRNIMYDGVIEELNRTIDLGAKEEQMTKGWTLY